MKILLLGVSGMLGSMLFKVMSCNDEHEVWGTLRNNYYSRYFSRRNQSRLINNVNLLDQDSVIKLVDRVRPDTIINCVGVIKQHIESTDPLAILPVNAMLPHRLANITKLSGIRLIHFSTDCVFSGNKGLYCEDDESDAKDLYGKSKYMGELRDYSHAITLRTSIIGHELESRYSLLDWFLSQKGNVKGYKRAIFSGLTTLEIANVVKKYVLPNIQLSGVYHVSSHPIDKMSLLELVAKIYEKKDIIIVSDEEVQINRSLDSNRFQKETGYNAQEWSVMLRSLCDYYRAWQKHRKIF